MIKKKEVNPPSSKRQSLTQKYIEPKPRHHVQKSTPYTYYNKLHQPLNHLLKKLKPIKFVFSHKKTSESEEAKLSKESLLFSEYIRSWGKT